MISKVKIKNYRVLKSTEVALNQTTNIIVGDNEVGKSTLLEAISLALTGQLNGRSIHYDLHPYLFNESCVLDYITHLQKGIHQEPPFFQIELFFEDIDDLALLKGTNNSEGKDLPGLLLRVELNENFSEDYATYISNPEQVTTVPVEFYHVVWRNFANKDLSPRTKPLKSTLIDTGDLRYHAGPQRYVMDTVSDFLEPADRARLALSYRHMKETFQADDSVSEINKKLQDTQGDISDKSISVSLDSTAKGNWEAGIITNLDGIPFPLVGKGEQSSVKIQLAMADAAEVQIFLIEEPENHLSFSRLHRLLSKIEEKAAGRQTFITTHSNFVLNKLDIGQVILFNGTNGISLNALNRETRDYFKKLPGHDTLRMILSPKVILVEGPSDELIVQKAIFQEYDSSHLSLGVDIISVKSLAFKRFLEISTALNIPTKVITDNDGNQQAVQEKYAVFSENQHVEVCFDLDETLPSLEDQLAEVNQLETLNNILNRNETSIESLVSYMKKNKTECALKIFNSQTQINIPTYIKHAIRELNN